MCIYTAARTAKASNYQLRACCQSDSPDFEFELDERKSVVKFASAVTLETLDILTRDTPDAPMAPRFSLHPDYPGSSAGPWDVFEPEGFEALVVPRPVSPHQCKAVRFFLNFHRETITSAHDFRWYDYPRLHTELIFAMGEESDALQYAICAFSALVYSVRVQQPIKELAFAFYAKALQQLRRSIDSSLVAVATSLELCAFEVCPKTERTDSAIFWRRRESIPSYPRSIKDHVADRSCHLLLDDPWPCPSRMVYAERGLLLFSWSVQTPPPKGLAGRERASTYRR